MNYKKQIVTEAVIGILIFIFVLFIIWSFCWGRNGPIESELAENEIGFDWFDFDKLFGFNFLYTNK